MHRSEFERFAAAIKKILIDEPDRDPAVNAGRFDMAVAILNVLNEYPRFDRNRFLKAAGFPQWFE